MAARTGSSSARVNQDEMLSCLICVGVDKVLVVDVEDRDDSAYREVTPIHGGVSGWRMLWDRLCPFPRLRCAPALAFGFIRTVSCSTHTEHTYRYISMVLAKCCCR